MLFTLSLSESNRNKFSNFLCIPREPSCKWKATFLPALLMMHRGEWENIIKCYVPQNRTEMWNYGGKCRHGWFCQSGGKK